MPKVENIPNQENVPKQESTSNQENVSKQENNGPTNRTPPPGSGSNDGRNRKICNWSKTISGLAIMAGLGITIWYLMGEPETIDDFFDGFGNFTDVLPNITNDGGVLNGDFWDNDPYLSNNSTQSWIANNNNNRDGLSLTIQNALDEEWQKEFELSVQDWDNGDPDALTLTTERVAIDHSCSQVTGVMKVCNGNYGKTGWLGINEILSDSRTGQIRSSVAKMNEYYLLNADYYERQYTMCHELGHGFGLPHTDESFTNKDLGNCMDYTKNPQDNLHPDASNYNRLKSLYGVVPSSRKMRRQMTMKEETPTTTMQQQEYLRVRFPVTATPATPARTPMDIQNEYKQAVEEFMMLPGEFFGRKQTHTINKNNDRNIFNSSFFSWRMLQQHENAGSSSFVRKLSDDYELTIHVLKTIGK